MVSFFNFKKKNILLKTFSSSWWKIHGSSTEPYSLVTLWFLNRKLTVDYQNISNVITSIKFNYFSAQMVAHKLTVSQCCWSDISKTIQVYVALYVDSRKLKDTQQFISLEWNLDAAPLIGHCHRPSPDCNAPINYLKT